jgi:hypothetical protein
LNPEILSYGPNLTAKSDEIWVKRISQKVASAYSDSCTTFLQVELPCQ